MADDSKLFALEHFGNPIIGSASGLQALGEAVDGENDLLRILNASANKAECVVSPTDILRTGDRQVLLKGTVSDVATLAIDLSAWTDDYPRGFEIEFRNLRPASSNVVFAARTSSNGGSSFDAGASDYGWVIGRRWVNSANQDNLGYINNNALQMLRDQGNTVDRIANFSLRIWGRHSDTTHSPLFSWHGVYMYHDGNFGWVAGAGRRNQLQGINAIQFWYSSGHIAETEYTVLGHK